MPEIDEEDEDQEEQRGDIEDMTASMDIDEFEKKLRSAKLKKEGYGEESKIVKGSSEARNNLPTMSFTAIQEIQKEMSRRPPESQSKLSAIQQEIVTNKRKSEKEEIEATIATRDETAKDKKLRELVQKNKELTVMLGNERGKRAALETQLKAVEEQPKTKGTPVTDDRKSTAGEDFKAKYNQSEKKLQELRIANTSLKSELNKAMRVIAREVGEDINLDKVLSEENSWKGRAQQIEILKGKLRELQARNDQSLAETRGEGRMMKT
eukprot:TRINITY_DN4594_c0_g1_i8.p1 TRINITY_DN4594_c0_g1~~TRINITY_DN4594_c0_g1_i8.p1  ORF type:complete len:266 (+),score=77.47 TRINITY_DN4594_c0_g1_i8:217-1014(+)